MPTLAADLVPRLGVDVVRYTFIVVDFHLLLLAGVTGASLFLALGRLTYSQCEYGRLPSADPKLSPLETRERHQFIER